MKSATLTKFGAAFLRAQTKIQKVKKTEWNPYHKKHYADLTAINEAIMPLLNEEGIAVLAPIVLVENVPHVETMLLHVESGEYINSITRIINKNPNDPQTEGSAITYARRYGLQSVCNISVEDDDANGASGKVSTPVAEQTPAALVVDLTKRENDYIDKIKSFTKIEQLGEFRASIPKEHWTQKMVAFATQKATDIKGAGEVTTMSPPAQAASPAQAVPVAEETKQEEHTPPATPAQAAGHTTQATQAPGEVTEATANIMIAQLKIASLQDIENFKKTWPRKAWLVKAIFDGAVARKTELENAATGSIEEDDLGM